ncbi:uncharacterized protein LOC112559227 [Pomacea canaliculata]|uniref:uncharacterized protein LOC112559227 n=1 Tax=Pomacea canaliculata TaxID=400727 RepID=UPI000D735ABF|nr:uncharacterized protein LOC112559227 [Pomacea canaliculata]
MELCLATVATPQLVNGKTYNETEPIDVKTCDKGKLTFTVNMGSTDRVSKMDVVVTFYTNIILAMPPTCSIPWNGTYLELYTSNTSESPLPTCFVSNSQEGYHTMYYWFRLLDWTFFTLQQTELFVTQLQICIHFHN